MTHEHDQERTRSRMTATSHDADGAVEPGQSSRSAVLRKSDQAIASGLVQRKASGSGAASLASDDVVSRLGTGSSLSPETQATMSETLGNDFSGVKIHTDNTAAVLCKEMNAHAFTIGNDVAFGAGQYRPGTPEGDGLIAHELTHTVQQKEGRTTQLSGLGGDAGTRDALEQEADNNAAKIQRKAKSGGSTDGLEAEADAAGAKAAGKSKQGEQGGKGKEDPEDKGKLTAAGEPVVTLVSAKGEAPPATSPSEGGVQRKAIQLEGGPSSVDILGAVVNTAQAAWDIVKDNRPQQTVGTKFCNALPQSVPWNELYGWRTYDQTWRVQQSTNLGTNLLDATFTITYQWRGQTDRAQGWFLNNYTIFANSCDVGWGWTVNVNAGVSGDAFNAGTRDFPIGAIPLLMTTSQSSVLSSSSYTNRYTASGDGGLQTG
jgi:Domain of unknown function (DUF4157)